MEVIYVYVVECSDSKQDQICQIYLIFKLLV